MDTRDQAQLHHLISRLVGNDAELGRVQFSGYNRQLVYALQRTEIKLEFLLVDVANLIFNDTSEDEHFTTYLSTVSTLQKAIFFGGSAGVVSRTLSPDRVSRLVEAVWSNPCIGRLQISFRVPFQLGGLFRTHSSITNMQMRLWDFDSREDQDEFVNGAAQNNSWHSLKLTGDPDGGAMMQQMLDEGVSRLTRLTELEISTMGGASLERVLTLTQSIERVVIINCNSSFDNEPDWSASIWVGLQVNQTIRELIFTNCTFSAIATRRFIECMLHHRKEFMRRVGIIHCTFHGTTDAQVTAMLFTSQLGTALVPAEVEFAPINSFHHHDGFGNVMRAISTTVPTKVYLGGFKLHTETNRDVQDVCQYLPSIGNVRHFVLHRPNPPRANSRDQLDQLLVALRANGSLVTFDLTKWAGIVDERYLRTFHALLERNERVPEMVGRFQTPDKAPLRPHLFQVATATHRVTPNTFLRGLLSLDQNVAATMAEATATIPTSTPQMAGKKRTGPEMDEATCSPKKMSKLNSLKSRLRQLLSVCACTKIVINSAIGTFTLHSVIVTRFAPLGRLFVVGPHCCCFMHSVKQEPFLSC